MQLTYHLKQIIYQKIYKPILNHKFILFNNRIIDENNNTAVVYSQSHLWSSHPSLSYSQKQSFIFSPKMIIHLLKYPTNHYYENLHFFHKFITKNSNLKYLDDFNVDYLIDLSIYWMPKYTEFKIINNGKFETIQIIPPSFFT